MQLQQDMLFDGRYRLIRLLGRGGFSEVWLVEDAKVLNKKMALKIYSPGQGLDDDGVQLFSSEFELVFDLNHTNLLRPAHFDVCNRSPYLIMPFCERGSAARLIGKITEEEAWQFLYGVAAGLAHLHRQDPPIIHQDIKPDNILIDHNGQYLITDFGISTKVRSTLRKSMGVAKSAMTIAYTPSERFGKENAPIKASDIWSLGATLFELMTGDVPFGEHGGLLQKSGAEIPDITNHYSDKLKRIVNSCLALHPWDRPTASDLTGNTGKHIYVQPGFTDNQELKLLQNEIESLCNKELYIPAFKKCREMLAKDPASAFAREKRQSLELKIEIQKKKQKRKETAMIIAGIIVSIIVSILIGVLSVI